MWKGIKWITINTSRDAQCPDRLRSKTEDNIGDQFGFQKEMGTRETISVVRTLVECSNEHDQEVFICFVDYEKVFGTTDWDVQQGEHNDNIEEVVDWTELMGIRKALGVAWRDRRLISVLHGQTWISETVYSWKRSKTGLLPLSLVLQHLC